MSSRILSPPDDENRSRLVIDRPDVIDGKASAGSAARRPLLAHGLLLVIALLLGLSNRMALTEYGEVGDVLAWRKAVAAIEMGNLYKFTDEYNYGPVWGYALLCLHRVSTAVAPDTPANFHVAVSLFLSLIDIIIAYILYLKSGLMTSVIYYFCPVTMLITGFYGQFYNLGLLPGLVAFALLNGGGGRAGGGRVLAASALLGASLATKHFLIFYPLWLALGPGISQPWHRVALATIPYLAFFASFAPFLGDPAAVEAIRRNVFEFESHGLGALLPRLLEIFVPPRLLEVIYGALAWVPVFHGVKLAWASLMLLVGWMVMRRRPGESLFFYLAAMVALTPMMIEIYLLIPVAACAALRRFMAARIYLVVSSLLLFLNFAWRATRPDPALLSINALMPWRVDNPDMVSAQVWLMLLLVSALWATPDAAGAGPGLEPNGPTGGPVPSP